MNNENCWACGVAMHLDELDPTEYAEQGIVELDVDGRVYTFCCEDCADDWFHSDDCCAGRYDNYDDPMYEDYCNPCDFREPGGQSALRNGPRIHPCPNCGEPNILTPADKAHGYQCDACADQLERGW
jgi:hypothetical protein